MTDYEKEYQRLADICGLPFQEFIDFFDDLDETNLRVLDLGCGQGRDALMIARHGHQVHGVDLSPTGIKQMLEQAQSEQIQLTGEVADIRLWEPQCAHDIIILDRVVHMLGYSSEKMLLLEKSIRSVEEGGFILIADTPKNLDLIRDTFANHSGAFDIRMDRKGFIFYHRRTSR